MIKTLMITAALVVGVSAGASARTMTGKSATVSQHHMMMKKKKHGVSYGIGSSGRTTATGGNAGGYSSRN